MCRTILLMFPTCKNIQKCVKNQESIDKHSSFDGLIQEDIDMCDIYLAVGDAQNLVVSIRSYFLLDFL